MPSLSAVRLSWPAPFQSGSDWLSLPRWDLACCTEPTRTEHSMRPKLSASFASLESIERRMMCGAYTIPQCTLRRSGCLFNICGFNLNGLFLTCCVWDLFYSLKKIGSIWMFVVTACFTPRGHDTFINFQWFLSLVGQMICPLMQKHFLWPLSWSVKLFIAAK